MPGKSTMAPLFCVRQQVQKLVGINEKRIFLKNLRQKKQNCEEVVFK